jgi:glycosyltransferase involved in cell wall biosynthesis
VEWSSLLVRRADIYLLHECMSWRYVEEIPRLPEGALLVADADDDLAHSAYEPYDVAVDGPGDPDHPPLTGETRAQYDQRARDTAVVNTWPARHLLKGAGDWRVLTQVVPADDANGRYNLQLLYRAVTTCDTLESARRYVRAHRTYAALEEIYRQADLVTCSTTALAERYADLNDYTCVLPNCIDLSLPCYRRPPVPHEGVVIGWAGANSHEHDFAPIVPVLVEILTRYDGANGRPFVRLMLGGGSTMWRLFEDTGLPGMTDFLQRVESAWQARLHGKYAPAVVDAHQYVYKTAIDNWDALPDMYTSVDIGVIPNVVGTTINDARSDLKGLEMAGMGVPSVASPIPSYVETRKGNDTGCIVLDDNEPTAWTEALTRLIEDAEARATMAADALRFARSRSIDLWAPRWMDVYRQAGRRLGQSWAE